MIKVTIEYKYRHEGKTYKTTIESPDVDFDIIKDIWSTLDGSGYYLEHIDIAEVKEVNV